MQRTHPFAPADDVQVLDNVLADAAVPKHTRGTILKQAALAAAVGAGVLGPASKAWGAHGTSDSVQESPSRRRPPRRSRSPT
jgi:hypothetical protein